MAARLLAVSTRRSWKDSSNCCVLEIPLMSRTSRPDPADITYHALVRVAIMAEIVRTVIAARAASARPW